MPPLRERQEDIPLLAEHFMAEFARGVRPARRRRFEPGAVAVLQQYAWPGNVRELRNVIERLMIMVPGDSDRRRDLGVPRAAGRRRAAEPAARRPSA